MQILTNDKSNIIIENGYSFIIFIYNNVQIKYLINIVHKQIYLNIYVDKLTITLM